MTYLSSVDFEGALLNPAPSAVFKSNERSQVNVRNGSTEPHTPL